MKCETNDLSACSGSGLRTFDRRDFAKDLDGSLGFGEQANHLCVVLQSFHGVGKQFLQPARILEFRCRQVLYACFKILAICVDAAEGDLVAENKTEIDLISGNLKLTRSA